MTAAIDLLWWRTWWEYRRSPDLLYSIPYHWFNLAEGIVWLALGILVLVRRQRHAQSRLELWYAAAFVTFALTDFREAWALQSWLIWIKLANLIALFWLRATVIRRFYPERKLY